MQDDISMIDENTRNVCNCFATRCQVTSKSLENFYIYIYILLWFKNTKYKQNKYRLHFSLRYKKKDL